MTATLTVAERAGFYLFALTASLAPLPFGATDPAVAGVIGTMLGVCLLLAALSPRPPGELTGTIWVTLFLSACVLVWTVVQAMTPHLTAAAHPLLLAASKHIAGDAEVPAAVRYPVLLSAGYVLIPLAAFLCALVLVRDDKQYKRFLHILLGINFFVAAGCIIQFLLAPQTLLWSAKRHYLDAFTGTFINPNTAATQFGVLLLLALGVSLRQLRKTNLHIHLESGTRSPRESRNLRMLMAYALAAFTFLVALLLTKSRAGIISSLAGVVALVGSFAYFELRRQTSMLRAFGMTALSILAAIGVFLFLSERLLLRIHDQGLIEPGRVCAFRSTWNAIMDQPWWGTGLGTFQEIFPAYRTSDCGLTGHWEMAHSVFLEGWLVFGAPFLACAAIAFLELVRIYVRGTLRRRRYRFSALTCLGILLLVSLHSLVDFSVQIPGFSVVLAALLGAGVVVSLRPRT